MSATKPPARRPGAPSTAEVLAGGDRAAIVVDVDLDPIERNAVLAHDERGGGIDAPYMPPGWDAVVAREEELVEREVARRLVPVRELDAFLERRRELGEPVLVGDIIEEFDVPAWVADRALRSRAGGDSEIYRQGN